VKTKQDSPGNPVSLRGKVPSVDSFLRKEEIVKLMGVHPRSLVVKAVRETIDRLRASIRSEASKGSPLPEDAHLVSLVEARVRELTIPGIRRVINATGIILHTGMGRAVLPRRAVQALQSMEGFVNVQADIHSGRRSQRDYYVERQLMELTGAEAAFIVNNNAAATMLVLNTLAEGKEVIVSRGQLIEIGGSFRLPDVMEKSGAIMKEVGTTNRTHLRDYEKAINERTGCIFRAHHSNYRIEGFAHEPDIQEMVQVGKQHGIPVVDDLGAGAFIDLSAFGFSAEPLVQRSLKAGADLVFFSGDKLVGGPQAGIIVGKKEYIKKIRANPLARALRVCKLTLVALEATLYLHFDPDRLVRENPVYMLLARDLKSISTRATALQKKLRSHAPTFTFAVADDVSYMGSGSLPMEDIRTKVIVADTDHMNCDQLARFLRERDFPIFSRIKDNRVLLDMRTVLDGEEKIILEAFKELHQKLQESAAALHALAGAVKDPIASGQMLE